MYSAEAADGARPGAQEEQANLGEERYRVMLRIRLFEEKVIELASLGEIPGPVHDYSGQEAVAVGVCEALRPNDLISSTHRGHGHSIARGVGLRSMFAELMARETGTNRGRGGSMHVADVSRGILGANGMVGAGAPIVTGATWAARQQGQDVVGVSFFGDGAVNQGVFLEAMNLASAWNVPILFACENNGYAISFKSSEGTGGTLADRAAGFGLGYVAIDGMDIAATTSAAKEAVDQMRVTGRPTFLEFETYRYSGHNTGERFLGMTYRTDDEVASWRERDPLIRAVAALGPATAAAIRESVELEVDDAVEFARSSPSPAPESALEFMYTAEPMGGLR